MPFANWDMYPFRIAINEYPSEKEEYTAKG